MKGIAGLCSMRSRLASATAAGAMSLVLVSVASAQTAEQPEGGAAAALAGPEIIVTATKRPEGVQDVPVAVTAFGDEQLAALNFRDVGSLGFVMPNVAPDHKIGRDPRRGSG